MMNPDTNWNWWLNLRCKVDEFGRNFLTSPLHMLEAILPAGVSFWLRCKSFRLHSDYLKVVIADPLCCGNETINKYRPEGRLPLVADPEQFIRRGLKRLGYAQ